VPILPHEVRAVLGSFCL